MPNCEDQIPIEPQTPTTEAVPVPTPRPAKDAPLEIGGRAGPEPTRYGDWELRGRCIDF
jgi:hypothetical protein